MSSCGGAAPVPVADAVEQAVAAGPGRNSVAYRPPDTVRAHELGGALLAVLQGEDDVPLPDGVVLREAVDGAGRPVTVVAEDPGRTARGWGVYAARPGAGAPAGLVVEVPHPRADRSTEDLGAVVFAAARADALLVAGAHRRAGNGAADVARDPTSAFSAVDRAVVGPESVVLQLHGFDEATPTGSPDVVLSSGEADPGPVAPRLADALEDAGFEVCLYDGDRCSELAGTRNVQGAHARSVGATFLHLELSRALRQEGAARTRLVDALNQVLAR